MKAYPYLIHDLSSQKGERLSPLDPRKKEFDEKWLQGFLMNRPDILPTYDIEPIFYPLVPIANGQSLRKLSCNEGSWKGLR
jgi:hypothetical protein